MLTGTTASHADMPPAEVAIVGGGIVGLATGLAIKQVDPDCDLVIVEKEPDVACHQSGRNSGVLHAGAYYKPGSMKAKFCRAGHASMVSFCQEHNIPYKLCGKIIVATGEQETVVLRSIYERSRQNGLESQWLSSSEALELEPHVQCDYAVRIADEGITDYKVVSCKMKSLLESSGTRVKCSTEVRAIHNRENGLHLLTSQGEMEAGFVVNCAGLFSDRLAVMTGLDPRVRIFPFRGEYFRLKPEKTSLVNGMIYPVPDPDFPFLGIHLTRSINGGIHVGPNAVLSLKREGYSKTSFDLGDAKDILMHRGFLSFGLRHMSAGAREVYRSMVKSSFTKSVQRLVPAVTADDLVESSSGVRAQAMDRKGELKDDFVILDGPWSIHVCNAPSPGATASLEIGKAISKRLFEHPQGPRMRLRSTQR